MIMQAQCQEYLKKAEIALQSVSHKLFCTFPSFISAATSLKRTSFILKLSKNDRNVIWLQCVSENVIAGSQ